MQSLEATLNSYEVIFFTDNSHSGTLVRNLTNNNLDNQVKNIKQEITMDF